MVPVVVTVVELQLATVIAALVPVVTGVKAHTLLKASLNTPERANSPQSPGLAQFERCAAENKHQSAPPKSWTTKPVLMISHPFTMAESVHKQLVNALTGLSNSHDSVKEKQSVGNQTSRQSPVS